MSSAAPARPQIYDPIAKALHWIVALLIVMQLLIAWRMPEVHRDTRPEGAIAWHLTIGVLILVLVAVRVLWRLARPPAAEGPGAGLARRAARAGHALLYLLLVLVPVLGWANASSRNWAVGLGGLELPRLMPAGSPLGHELGDVHGWLAWALGALAALHVLVGLYHQFVLRDGTMQRMA